MLQKSLQAEDEAIVRSDPFQIPPLSFRGAKPTRNPGFSGPARKIKFLVQFAFSPCICGPAGIIVDLSRKESSTNSFVVSRLRPVGSVELRGKCSPLNRVPCIPTRLTN